MSDVYLTEHCRILSKIFTRQSHTGCLWVFFLHDSASLYCMEVKVPSFTKGKVQLSKHEVDTTHELAQCLHSRGTRY